MSIRFGLILLGLVVAWGCARPTSYHEAPADSYTSTEVQLRIADRQIAVDGARVSPEFWGETGGKPQLGRLFVPEEYASPSSHRVAVLSHELWQQSFGSDPAVIGRAVELDGVPTTVIGILSPGFRFPEGARLWMPEASGSRGGSPS